MTPTYDFRDQVALVTGAASGMGLATARAFAEAGAAVVLADIDEEAVQHAAEELTAAAGHQAIGVACDVTDEAQAAAMVDRAVATYGRLDMAFNNAGVQVPPSDAADETAENFDHVNASTCEASGPPRSTNCAGCGSRTAAAPSSTAPRWGASWVCRSVPPTTRPSTA